MHKKLATDLISLAHSVLQMKNKEDVVALKEKAQEIYEKLSVLAYVDEYVDNTPNATATKEELIAKIEEISKSDEEFIAVVEEKETVEIPVVLEEREELIIEIEEKSEEIFKESFIAENLEEATLFSVDLEKETKPLTLEEELKDTISLDVAADLFEKVVPEMPLNNALLQNIQIGLNDRIAFVKYLFNGDQGDFNRVVSQINTFKTQKEAKKFINKMVKPDYNWSEKSAYEERFMTIVERKFS